MSPAYVRSKTMGSIAGTVCLLETHWRNFRTVIVLKNWIKYQRQAQVLRDCLLIYSPKCGKVSLGNLAW